VGRREDWKTSHRPSEIESAKKAGRGGRGTPGHDQKMDEGYTIERPHLQKKKKPEQRRCFSGQYLSAGRLRDMLLHDRRIRCWKNLKTRFPEIRKERGGDSPGGATNVKEGGFQTARPQRASKKTARKGKKKRPYGKQNQKPKLQRAEKERRQLKKKKPIRRMPT